ncbi:MAG TPA: hypothetical protein VMH81_39985 [Bryobacteraceae bacterium]|nr:hypothetical protein [Bryobacteraceae bacterium]
MARALVPDCSSPGMTAIQDCRGQPAMRLLTNFIFAFDHDHEQHQRAEARPNDLSRFCVAVDLCQNIAEKSVRPARA